MLTCEDLAFGDLLFWAKNGQNELVRRVHMSVLSFLGQDKRFANHFELVLPAQLR